MTILIDIERTAVSEQTLKKITVITRDSGTHVFRRRGELSFIRVQTVRGGD